MKDRDSKLLWESYVSENQQYFEQELSKIRASLKNSQEEPLADVLRDVSRVTKQSEKGVKVTYANLQRPYVIELDDGTHVLNYERHWSQKPGDRLERVAYGTSIQHAFTHDSTVSSGADKIGPETSLPRVINTVFIKEEPVDDDTLSNNQQAKDHAAKDIAKWKHD